MRGRLLHTPSPGPSRIEAAAQGPNETASSPPERSYWMVGAYWKGFDPPDQTSRFIEEGLWENGYDETPLDLIKTMAVGDRIALKATTTQKENLPFAGDGRAAPKMIIKAIGTITHNPQNGYRVDVAWDKTFQPRDWYFYTCQQTVWRLRRDTPPAQHLIDFAFHGAAQDYAFFAERRWPAARDQGRSPEIAALRRALSGPPPRYGIEDVLAEGVFLTRDEIALALDRLRTKKNLILQGPPGVGKTFIARKLADALMGARDGDRTATVQFHQSYSYEDFVRGYRPASGRAGSFALTDGPFLRFCERARRDPGREHVFVVDEINRGNLSQIFGELMMLLEADKRGPRHAIALAYPRHDAEMFYVPANVHLIGTMNLADRSLALVDYALRRRFAFVTLPPQFENPRFHAWLTAQGMDAGLAGHIVARMTALNRRIAEDRTLGPAFCIGHSVFIPDGIDLVSLDRPWYAAIIETEIAPLLESYWHDDPRKLAEAVRALLA